MPRTQLYKPNHDLGGKPKEYLSEYHDEEGFKMALAGKTAKQIASRFNTNLSTIKRWFISYPTFRAAVNAGRDEADELVTASLFQRATGYTKRIKKNYIVSLGDGVTEVQEHEAEIYFPPDVGAAMNWLKNRQPEKWRERKELDIPANIVVTLNIDNEERAAKELPTTNKEDGYTDFLEIDEKDGMETEYQDR